MIIAWLAQWSCDLHRVFATALSMGYCNAVVHGSMAYCTIVNDYASCCYYTG
jgi:hypothetical protein